MIGIAGRLWAAFAGPWYAIDDRNRPGSSIVVVLFIIISLLNNLYVA